MVSVFTSGYVNTETILHFFIMLLFFNKQINFIFFKEKQPFAAST